MKGSWDCTTGEDTTILWGHMYSPPVSLSCVAWRFRHVILVMDANHNYSVISVEECIFTHVCCVRKITVMSIGCQQDCSDKQHIVPLD